MHTQDWLALTDEQQHALLSKRLKEHRLHKNLTQKELAQKCGVRINSVVHLEKGQWVSFKIFLAILRGLKISSQLNALVPEQTLSPIALLEAKTKEKKRVRKSKSEIALAKQYSS